MSAERFVKLWDGKRYSVDEVEAACPGLAEYAAENESLEANFPAPELPRLRLAIAALLVITLAITTVLRLYGVGWLGTAVTAGLLFFAGILPIHYGVWVRSWRYPRTVAIQEGKLSITTPRATKKFPLDQCWWKWGTTFHNGGFIMSGKKRPAIVIVCPEDIEGAKGEDTIIGMEEAFFPRFHAFLVLAGVPSVSKRSGLRKAAMVLAHILAGGLLGFLAGEMMGSVVDQLRGDEVLGDLIAFASTFTGCFLGILYVVSIYFEGPLSATKLLTHFYVPVLKIFAMYGVSLAIASQNALVGMLIVAVSLVIGWCVAYCFIQQKLRQKRRAQKKASEPIPFANPIEGL